jgi:hypothetical protein
MHDMAVIGQFQRRLVELGCPTAKLREQVRELADHHQDLKDEALRDGLSEPEAAARADAQLGDTVRLAEKCVALLRQSSWWGRHPIIGFCFLPLFAFVPAWFLGGGILAGMCWLLARIFGPAYSFDEDAAHALSLDPTAFNNFAHPLNAALTFFAALSVGLLFFWLARRSAVGMKWVFLSCALAAVTGFFTYSMISPNLISVGIGWPAPNRIFAVVPLLIAGAALLQQRRLEKPLPAIPFERRSKICAFPGKAVFWRTPTYWVAAILGIPLAILLIGGLAVGVYYSSETSKDRELRTKVWPAERAATLRQLTLSQTVIHSVNPTLINLKPWLNAPLTATTDGIAGADQNNLAQLPRGIHAFGGIPFDVEGKLQLCGLSSIKAGRKLPGRVKNIAIHAKGARLNLLHGASAAQTLGNKIARLIVHYQDGSQTEIGIVAGDDVLDWWGPLYNTEAGNQRHPRSQLTVLAWAGSNPWIQKRSPDSSLRLYRTTFSNPHPELEISSVDYVSTMSQAAPFLIALTVDQPEISQTKK